MAKEDPRHFTRDTSLASEVADQFGGEAANAEALQEANALQFSEDLIAAQLLPADEGQPDEKKAHPELAEKLDRAAVAKKASVDEVVSYGIHGDYVVYAFETPDGRLHKDVLRIVDGEVQEADEDSPQRAQIRAQLEADQAIRAARSEADEIIREAEAKRAEILKEAAEEAQKARDEKVAEAAEAERKAAEEAASGSSSSSKSSGTRRRRTSKSS